ncbi:dienelactone hydrolase family protein [Paracandidimonas lactea]|uniref:dienelactone hydrolase family protein n=1 Tax=Paracandidimonas lactea TaxID=2895524 RepID=UPI001F239DAB|nr:dienelactone hydrolase family protein [Paracandidimonas lactea]
MKQFQGLDFASELDSLRPALRLDRRGFIAGTLASGFALAAGPVCADTVVKTPDTGLETGMVDVPAKDGKLPAYYAMPAGKTGLPLVLVVHEIFGVHEYIKDVCRRLAHQGYMAVAPQLFFRQGDPSRYTEIAPLFQEVVSKVPDAQVMADLDASAAWAGVNGADTSRVAITGFCWGGRIVWLYAAHRPGLKAGVAWYGRLDGRSDDLHPKQPVDVIGALKAPVLGLYGGKDTGIPVMSVEVMEMKLMDGSEAAADSRFHIYPEAGHAFHADYRPTYRKDAAEDGWRRTLAWFGEYL